MSEVTASYLGQVLPVHTDGRVAFVLHANKRVLLSRFTAIQRAEAHNRPLFRRVRGSDERWRTRVKQILGPRAPVGPERAAAVRLVAALNCRFVSLPAALCCHTLAFLDRRSWMQCARTCQHMRRISVQRASVLQFSAQLMTIDWIRSGGARTRLENTPVAMRPRNSDASVIKCKTEELPLSLSASSSDAPIAHWSLWRFHALQHLCVERGMHRDGIICLSRLTSLRSLSLWLYESWTPFVNSLAPLRALNHLARLVFGAGPFCVLDFRADTPHLRELELARWAYTQATHLPASLEYLRLPSVEAFDQLPLADYNTLVARGSTTLKISCSDTLFEEKKVRAVYNVDRDKVPWHMVAFAERTFQCSAFRSVGAYYPFWRNLANTRIELLACKSLAPTGFSPWEIGQSQARLTFQNSSALDDRKRCYDVLTPALARVEGEWNDVMDLSGSPESDETLLSACIDVDMETGCVLKSEPFVIQRREDSGQIVQVARNHWKRLIGVPFEANVLYELNKAVRRDGVCIFLWRILGILI